MQEVLEGRPTMEPAIWAATVKACLKPPREQLKSLIKLGDEMYELLLAGEFTRYRLSTILMVTRSGESWISRRRHYVECQNLSNNQIGTGDEYKERRYGIKNVYKASNESEGTSSSPF